MSMRTAQGVRKMSAAMLAAAFSIWSGLALAQLPLPLPEPNLDLRNVASPRAAVALPDGTAFVSGDFRWIGGEDQRLGIVKIRPDGSVDPNWVVTAQTAYSLAIDGDWLYLAGSFAAVNGVARRGLARVSVTTGALDSWDPNFGSTSSYIFWSVLVAQNHVYVGGAFSQVGTTPRANLAKISTAAPAVLDASWDPAVTSNPPSGSTVVGAISADATNLYIGGFFALVDGQARGNAAKVGLADGVLDPTWAPVFNGQITNAVVDAGNFYAVGCFSSINVVARSFLGRVSTAGAGTLDANWNPAPNGGCTYGLTVTASDVYVGGAFTQVGGSAANLVGRVSKTGTGTPDNSWQPNLTGGVFAFGALPLSTGSVLVFGDFVYANGQYAAGLGRFTAAGGLQIPALHAEQRGAVSALAALPDQSTLVGGRFTRAGNVLRSNLLKLTPSGTLDAGFSPLVEAGEVNALAASATHIYLGGQFRSIDGQPPRYLGRMSLAGAVDTTWLPQPNSSVLSLALDSGSTSIYVGGSFISIGGQSRQRLAEIGLNNATATSWVPQADSTVWSLIVDGDGIIAGGDFLSIGGAVRNRIARVSRSGAGALDPAFIADSNGSVRALLVGPGDSLYVGGLFSTISGLGRPGFARLLRSTGTPDSTWNTFLSSGQVYALASGSAGVYVGGAFSTIGNTARSFLARVSHAGEVAPLFAPPGSNSVLAIVEQASRVIVGGLLNSFAPTTTRQIGVMAYPLNATPVATTTTITSDSPENTQRFQSYRVSVNVTGSGNVPAANQTVTVEDDLGALCSASLDGAGNGSCELSSREAGLRTLTARFAGTTLLLASTDTESHRVEAVSGTPPVNTAIALQTAGNPLAAVRLSDGSVVIGGNFTRVGELPRRGLARLLPDGNVDPAFSADVIGTVFSLARDASDNIYAVGSFGYIDGVLRRNVAKLDSLGNVIATWSAGETCVGTSFPDVVVDAAGDLILPGCVVFVSGSPNFYRSRLVKLSGATGALMSGLTAEVTTNSTTVFPQIGIRLIDGALYLHGQFNAVNGTVRSNLARIAANGTVDAGWNPAPNSVVYSIVGDGAGGQHIGGAFTQIVGQARSYLVQLGPTGAITEAFAPNPDSFVLRILPLGGRLHVTGFFSSIGGQARLQLAKLDPVTGAADGAYAGLGINTPNGIAQLGDAVWISLPFNYFGPTDVRAMGAMRFDATTGAELPTAFVSRQAFVFALAREPDGATLVGGYFVRPGSLQRNLVRIAANGTLETSFQPPLAPNSSIRAVKVDASGNIYVADGLTLRRLLPNGSFDPAFATALNSSVLSLHLVTDGVIAGGSFSTAAGVTRRGLVKLDYATGAVVDGWDANFSANAQVWSIAADVSGSLYVGGSFSSVAGTPRANLAKLTTAGALVPAWQADSNSTVRSLLVDGGSVYTGGFFTTIAGATRRGIARVAADNGTVDGTWNPAADRQATTYALALTQDGGILAGGSFNFIGGAYRSNAAKLQPTTGLADAVWNPSFDAPVNALLAGYGDTPVRNPQRGVLENIAIGGDFEFSGSSAQPGFVAVPAVGTPPDGIFCGRFEDGSCAFAQ